MQRSVEVCNVFGTVCGKGQPLCLEPYTATPDDTDAAAQLCAYM